MHCQEVDQPVAGLLTDLKVARAARRHAGGLGVGDGPHAVRQQPRPPISPAAITTSTAWWSGWPAATSRPGATFGETDEFSVRAAGEEIPLRDVHATMLRLMGLDQNRLTYLHAGRYKKLTDIGGRVIQEILA